MPPSNFKRKWIKLWIDECLTGTVREDLTAEERSVWYDFLLVAGRNRPPGCISANENTPISPKRLASILNIAESLVRRCIVKFEKSGRIRIRPNRVIYICNWGKYQYTDYDRQKPYRQEYPEYTYKMFCEDYDALKEELGIQGEGARTILYFTEKYGWEGVSSKGSRYHRFFLSTLKAVVNNDEKNPDNPDDEEVAKEILTSLQG